ncbi:MAG: nitrous oxide reductase family maturation protein NosD [Microscillaceae bacterium]|nr:nitrous oxide reductase family maturation protein NosD [Microscillaceae bacterium]
MRIIDYIFIGLLGLFFEKVQAIDIQVGPATHHKSLKAAIAQAQPGDTLCIQSGLYREGNLVIDKSLTLIGEGEVVLDGQHRYEVLTITASNVTVMGLTIKNAGKASLSDLAAIKIRGAQGVQILHNRIEKAVFGIYFEKTQHSRVIGNEIIAQHTNAQSAGNGIHVWKSEHLYIANNRIEGHRDGIYFEFVDDSKVLRNHSEGNLRYGLHFMFSHRDDYRHNVFVRNGAGIAVMYSRQVKMYHNQFRESWGNASNGLLLKEITDSEVAYNYFEKNTIGTYVEGAVRVNIEHNHFHANGWAIKLRGSSYDNVFRYNNFTGNSFDLSVTSSIVQNEISQNYWSRYTGYDLNRDGKGDVPYHPVSIYSVVVEEVPPSLILMRSFTMDLLEKTEKTIPSLTPEKLVDAQPLMKQLPL